jgi:Raf kinase inhibitor-like YbhB/YbcL family protein
MQLSSSAFEPGSPIPVQYTCDNSNVSPPLEWTGVPPAAKSLALIVDDPDAPGGTWVHWVLYDLPAASAALPEAVSRTQYAVAGSKQGLNDFGHLGYGGPCPPPGKPHRYHFKLYALDAELPLGPGAKKSQVEEAMKGHVVGQAELMGLYQRRNR